MTIDTTPTPSDRLPEQMRAALVENRKWFTMLGVLLIVLGALAILFPFVTGIAVTVFIGWLIFIGGIAQIVHTFSVKKWGGFLLSLLIGVVYVLAGGWLALAPVSGIVTLTILLSAAFLVQGGIETVMAFRIRDHEGWVWMLLSGIVALVVGALIFAELPSSAGWAIGLLTGINMISSGFAFFFLARAAGRQA
ncbi:HdeD family acid-resistance protein [Nitratireductor luteus]|uniref:HdeD family acid-resistance protein n=1 Tax=Nitratireductor luteus TaxID=2976980 RepID=UPI00223EC67D|nr:HdeD family acid-resistance protein [Nitratireductor luteus]